MAVENSSGSEGYQYPGLSGALVNDSKASSETPVESKPTLKPTLGELIVVTLVQRASTISFVNQVDERAINQKKLIESIRSHHQSKP